MTVASLIATLSELDPEDEVPLDLVVEDLTYIEDALEQWRAVADVFGRAATPEVVRFLEKARVAL